MKDDIEIGITDANIRKDNVINNIGQGKVIVRSDLAYDYELT
jgi:hypothetical protein